MRHTLNAFARAALCCALALLFAATAQAQFRASIQGTVTDAPAAHART